MGIWENFEDLVRPEEVVEELAKTFEPMEVGTYDFRVAEMVATESQSGTPMVKMKFQRIEDGRFLFTNEMLVNMRNPQYTATCIAKVVKLLGHINGVEYDYSKDIGSLSKLEEMIGNVEVGKEVTLKVSYDEKRDTEHKYAKVTPAKKVSQADVSGFIPNNEDDGLPFK